jgi:pyridoxine 4-dehydrogenase
VSAQPTAAAAGTIDVGGDLTVNRLGFGAMRITGPGIWGDPPSRDQAIATLRRVVELGVNFIDTADSYGPEVSETLIAEALHPYPEDLVIATKGGLIRPGPNRWEADGRPEHLREVCEGSLRRLRLDQIPLYQLHRPDPAVPLAESIGAIAELKSEGKIRHVGISNVSESQLREAQQIVPIVSVQNRYNVSDRRSESLIDLCEQEQMVFLPWAPIQETDRNIPVAVAAERHGVTQHQIVLAWLLATSPQILPIPGTGSPGHAEENIAAAAVELSPDEAEAISKGALPGCSRTRISGWLRRHLVSAPALTHTLPYDLALAGDQGVPVDYLAKIAVPVLVLGGANSPDWFHRTVEATTGAIPGARLIVLDGQDHGAPPEVIAPVLTDFFLGSGSSDSAAPRALGSMRALKGLRVGSSALGPEAVL